MFEQPVKPQYTVDRRRKIISHHRTYIYTPVIYNFPQSKHNFLQITPMPIRIYLPTHPPQPRLQQDRFGGVGALKIVLPIDPSIRSRNNMSSTNYSSVPKYCKIEISPLAWNVHQSCFSTLYPKGEGDTSYSYFEKLIISAMCFGNVFRCRL